MNLVSRRSLVGGSISALAVSALSSCGDPGEASRLSFLNWQDYIGDDTLSGFTAKTGVEVVYQTYASNDALYTLLQQSMKVRRGGRQATSFDLCVPSGEALDRLRRADLLQPLGEIAGVDAIRPDLQALAFDPQGEFGVPWAAGTTGIAYDTAVVNTPPTWADLIGGAITGATSVFNDSRDAIAAAALSGGQDPNDAKSFSAAAALLKGVTKNSETYLEELVTGKLVAAQAYSSDFVQAARRRPSLAFVIPKVGGLRWIDVLVIPRGAPRPGRAKQFIEYILTPTVSAALASAIGAGTAMAEPVAQPNASAGEVAALAAASADVDRCVFLRNLGSEEQDQLDKAWSSAT
jgi:spermidine/putrescine transport system substrate-binding protein